MEVKENTTVTDPNPYPNGEYPDGTPVVHDEDGNVLSPEDAQKLREKKLKKLKIPDEKTRKAAMKLIEAELKKADKCVKAAEKIARKFRVPFEYKGEMFRMYVDGYEFDEGDLEYTETEDIPEGPVTFEWWMPSNC